MVQTTRRWFLSKSKNKYRKEKEKTNLKKRIIKKIQITPTKNRGKEAISREPIIECLIIV